MVRRKFFRILYMSLKRLRNNGIFKYFDLFFIFYFEYPDLGVMPCRAVAQTPGLRI